jgi:predicted solute-binding protein
MQQFICCIIFELTKGSFVFAVTLTRSHRFGRELKIAEKSDQLAYFNRTQIFHNLYYVK